MKPDANAERLVRNIVDLPPFHRVLGVELVRFDQDAVQLRLPYRPEWLVTGEYVHGGLTATLIDIAGDCIVSAFVGSVVTTGDMRVDYLYPLRAGADLVATARAVRVGRNGGLADVMATDADGTLVAVGRIRYVSRG